MLLKTHNSSERILIILLNKKGITFRKKTRN